MKISIHVNIVICLFSLFFSPACSDDGHSTANNNADASVGANTIPRYVLVVHNEPNPADIPEFYHKLEELINKANDYHMKLTLMFTPPWVDFLLENNERASNISKWKSEGHEISVHHHGPSLNYWDGYSPLLEDEALADRRECCKHKASLDNISIEEACATGNSYNGTMEDYMKKMQKLDPDIKSGCMNEEMEKLFLPNAIIHPTCSGFANFGQAGRELSDSLTEKGINEFISVGTVNGIKRKWLAHSTMIRDTTSDDRAIDLFPTLDTNTIFGAVTHSIDGQSIQLLHFMEYLHTVDPTGEKSMTVSEAIESKILPLKDIDSFLEESSL